VVPSEVVYGPGGEKINRGIAYTALDGRMNSSFRIPVNSSYQEEAEARRMKREKAMMKSKMMRPSFPSDKWSLVDTSRRSPAVNNSHRALSDRDVDPRLGSRGRSSSMQNDSGASGPPRLRGRRKKDHSFNVSSRGGTTRSSQMSDSSNSCDISQKIVVDKTPSERSLHSIGRTSNPSSDYYTDSIGQSRDGIKGEGSQPESRSGSLLLVDSSSQPDSKKGSRSNSRRNSSTSVDSMGIQIVKSKDDIDSDEERSGGMSGSRRCLSLPGEISLSSSAQSSHWNQQTENLISGRRSLMDPSGKDSSERYMDMGVVIDSLIPHDMLSPSVTLGEIKRAQVRFHGDPESSDIKITRPISSLSLTSGHSPHISPHMSSDEIVSSGEDLESLGSSQVSSLGEHSPRSRSLSPHGWPFQKNKSFIIVRTNSQSMMNLGPLDNVNEWEEYENASPPLSTPVGELLKSNTSQKSSSEESHNARRNAFTTRDKSASLDYENEEMEEYDGEVDEWYYMEDQACSPSSDGRYCWICTMGIFFMIAILYI
jgi:hypothetical protein